MKPPVLKKYNAVIQYMDVVKTIIHNNISSQLQYRTSISIRLLGTLAELVSMLLFFKIIFSNINTLNNWTLDQVLILTLAFDVTRNILLACFIKNLPKLEDLLVNGKLDTIITKPIDTQFYVSFQQISLGHLLQVFVPLSILFYICATSESLAITPMKLILFSGNAICGTIIGYSLWIAVMSLTFFIVKVKSLHEIFLNLLQLGKYPSSIYGKFIKRILLFVFPILMVSSMPTEIFVGLSRTINSVYIIASTFITFYLSRKMWLFALKHYESGGG